MGGWLGMGNIGKSQTILKYVSSTGLFYPVATEENHV